jgi:phage terminase large subunit-like protein
MFDNPLLSQVYLRDECAKYVIGSRRYQEEVEGRVFAESAGALWHQDWLDANRKASSPGGPLRLVALDPALSTHADADATGICVGERADDGHVYALRDRSGKYPPEEWGDMVVDECVRGAAGVILERNHLGDHPTYVIRSRADSRAKRDGITLDVRVLPKDGKPFPPRAPGVIYVREVVAASSKTTRASGPASETEAGRVHLVGLMPELELELTTYEPGTRRSPNRLDAFVYLVLELRGLTDEKKPRQPKADAAAAKVAHDTLRDRLRGLGLGRVGI